MPTILKMIAVHHANKSGRGQAACFVSVDSAREMVEAGLAVWNKKATFINLTKTEAGITPAARSLKPGLSVMDGYVMGEPRDVAIIEAYRPRFAWAA